jgi:hypothetical protein
VGSGPAWSDEERAAALSSASFEEFDAEWPGRTRDSYRIKRNRLRSGTARVHGDGRARDHLAELRTGAAQNARRAPATAPKGWEPGIAWDGTKGSISTGPVERDPKWDEVLRVWNLDPTIYEIVEPIQMRAWDAAIGNGEVQRMFYYRAAIRTRVIRDRVDLDALIAEIADHRVLAPVIEAGDSSLVVALSDWQLGKRGTEAAVRRIEGMIDAVVHRLEDLRAIGRQIDTLTVLGLGDLIEGCSGFYDMQEFSVELDHRDQVKLTRRLLVTALTTWAPYVPRMVVAAVGGNHGENRRGGKAYTAFGDNEDVAVFEMAAEVLAANPAYDHVSFVLPRDDLTLCLDVAGTLVGLAHGHQSRGGVEKWWKGQAFGGQPVGDAAVLFTGHLHFLKIVQEGPRTHIQVPTMDSGSDWFKETSGTSSVAGTVSVVIGPSGWSDLAVL